MAHYGQWPTTDPMHAFKLKQADRSDLKTPLLKFVAEAQGKDAARSISGALDQLQEVRRRLQDAPAEPTEGTVVNMYHYVVLLFYLVRHVPIGDTQCRLSFVWTDLFTKKKVSSSLVGFEVAAVLLNAAVALALPATNAARSSAQLEQAKLSLLRAAGICDFIRSKVVARRVLNVPDVSAAGLELLAKVFFVRALHYHYLSALLTGTRAGELATIAYDTCCAYRELLLACTGLGDRLDKQWPYEFDFYVSVMEARAHVHVAATLHAQGRTAEEVARLSRAKELCSKLRKLGTGFNEFASGMQQRLNERIATARAASTAAVRVGEASLDLFESGHRHVEIIPLVDVFQLAHVADPFSVIPYLPQPKEAYTHYYEIFATYRDKSREVAQLQDQMQAIIVSLSSFEGSATGSTPEEEDLVSRILHVQQQIRVAGHPSCIACLTSFFDQLERKGKSCHETTASIERRLQLEAGLDQALREKYGSRWTRPRSDRANSGLLRQLTDLKLTKQSLEKALEGSRQHLMKNYDRLERIDLSEPRLREYICSGGETSSQITMLKATLDEFTSDIGLCTFLLADMQPDLNAIEIAVIAAHCFTDPISGLPELWMRSTAKIQDLIQKTAQATVVARQASNINSRLEAVRSPQKASPKSQNYTTLSQCCSLYEEFLGKLTECLVKYESLAEGFSSLSRAVDHWISSRNAEKEALLTSVAELTPPPQSPITPVSWRDLEQAGFITNEEVQLLSARGTRSQTPPATPPRPSTPPSTGRARSGTPPPAPIPLRSPQSRIADADLFSATLDAESGSPVARAQAETFMRTVRPQQGEVATKLVYDLETQSWHSSPTRICIYPEPIGVGNLRVAYRMVEFLPDGSQQHFVAKESRGENPDEDEPIYYQDVQTQVMARALAKEYNKHHPPKKIDFLDCFLVRLDSQPPLPSGKHQLRHVEPYLPGHYEKHNNNWGFVAAVERNTPQAFSHFTFHHTAGMYLVIDIQGVGDIYTDPQIHSYDGSGFGLGNSGQEGIEKFFATHRCNSICKFLRLPEVNPKALDEGTRVHSADPTLHRSNFASPATPHFGLQQLLPGDEDAHRPGAPKALAQQHRPRAKIPQFQLEIIRALFDGHSTNGLLPKQKILPVVLEVFPSLSPADAKELVAGIRGEALDFKQFLACITGADPSSLE
eukprot:TRINITY_DN15833_c0_g1_i1.p1 TRINITY_DN15833_c0_g1~~TRINITY_DN15833_c0_g1_i1.p1  ORF type:complete len:1179 (-),score=193.52 TRINITY_DN15833_c0_g1_i1:7-3516(-)